MGLFDTVRCEYPLPDTRHQDLEYQTKDLGSSLSDFTITRDGRLVLHPSHFRRGPDRDVEWPMHGDISIYTSLARKDPAGKDREWVEYIVRFTHGRVESVRSLEEVRQNPSLVSPSLDRFPEPPAPEEPAAQEESPEAIATETPSGPAASSPASLPGEPGQGTRRDAEEALLQNLRRDRPELEKLLASCSDHWGYEDPIYRFYHQSFKVYWLQRATQSIVQKLQALAPARPLNAWFAQIVQAGTGKVFQQEDNARWTEVTRPILEAFFHARFFLAMAVRYGDLETPPQTLPSGYAALLYLFGLR